VFLEIAPTQRLTEKRASFFTEETVTADEPKPRAAIAQDKVSTKPMGKKPPPPEDDNDDEQFGEPPAPASGVTSATCSPVGLLIPLASEARQFSGELRLSEQCSAEILNDKQAE
jgi:hypothetical protein